MGASTQAFRTDLLILYFLLKSVDLKKNFMIDRVTDTLEIGVSEPTGIVLHNLGLGETALFITSVGFG